MGLISGENMPVIWRGPMVSGAVMQLLSQTDWGELDYLIVDTPPGTGDVQLTLLQRIPLTSSIVVTTPQEVSISDCKKGIEMIKRLDKPITGLGKGSGLPCKRDGHRMLLVYLQQFLGLSKKKQVKRKVEKSGLWFHLICLHFY